MAAVTNRHKPGGLKTTGIHSLTVLEARSLKLGCQQGPGPSRGSRRGSVLVSLSFRGSRYFLACASITSVSTSDSPRPSLLLYLPSFLLKITYFIFIDLFLFLVVLGLQRLSLAVASGDYFSL